MAWFAANNAWLSRLVIQRGTAAIYLDRKSTRLNSSHRCISYAVFCLKKKTHVIVAPHKNPVEFYAVVFFVMLTLGSFIPLMLFTVLDMLRNIFPNAALIKKENKDDEI